MLKPTFEEFKKKSSQGSLIPVYKEILADLDTPVSAYMKISEGKYSFLAKVNGSEMSKRGGFDVKAIQLEQLHTVANHKLLFQLSNNSGGKLFYLNQLDEVATTINQSNYNYTSISVAEKLKGIINIPWILLLLLVIISFEWFIRKYNGLI